MSIDALSTEELSTDALSKVEVLNPGLKGLGTYEYGWSDSDAAGVSARRGLNEEVVADISGRKSEPQWMLDLRMKGLKLFGKKPMPSWGSDLTGIDFQNIKYFVKSTEKQATSWEELPEDIRNTYDRLGIPEAEKQRLVGGVRSTSLRSSTTRSVRTWRSKASSSSIRIRACVSTKTCFVSTSPR